MIRRGGTYYLRVTHEGRDIRRSLGTDYTEACRRLRVRLAGILDGLRAGGEDPSPRVATVSEFGTRWLGEYVAQRRIAKDQQVAAYRFWVYTEPVLGGIRLDRVDVSHQRRLRASLEAEGLAAQTVWHVLSDLRCLLNYAVDTGILYRSPWSSKVLPKLPRLAPRRLTADQLRVILPAVPAAWLPAVLLALHTGLRWGEVRNLQWRHLVLEPTPHLVVEKTKSGKVRRVPLNGEAMEVLRELRVVARSVFILNHRPVQPHTAYRVSGRVTGIRWNYHQLRHTFACRWLERGGSKEALQKILGHASVQTTERYGDLSDEAVAEEMRRVESGKRR